MKRKYRLSHTDDLSYLLDVLIYHLRPEVEITSDLSYESRDAKGRNEEEQIGTEDDEERSDEGQFNEEMASKTLALCHAKVRLLVSRMIKQMENLHERKSTMNEIIIRLTGVLAVLRQVRNCDGKVVWIKSFFESSEEHKEMMRNNAFMVALAQLIKNDAVVIKEARQSIGAHCITDWLTWLLKANKKLDEWLEHPEILKEVKEAHAGDIALHKHNNNLKARLIRHCNAQKVSLVFWGKDRDSIEYTANFIKAVSFEHLTF